MDIRTIFPGGRLARALQISWWLDREKGDYSCLLNSGSLLLPFALPVPLSFIARRARMTPRILASRPNRGDFPETFVPGAASDLNRCQGMISRT